MQPVTSRILVVATFIALATAGSGGEAQALSKAAKWLVTQQIAQGCESKSGTFAAGSVIERDLTGDGEADLIIDHGGLQCTGGGLRLYCGIRACSVLFYVREGKLLHQKAEILSIGASVADGTPPVIEIMSHGFEKSSVKWNGSTFD